MRSATVVFLRFLQHDLYIYRKRIGTLLLNYGLLYPFCYAVAMGSIMAHAYFGNDTTQGTTLLIGQMVILPLVFANNLNAGLLHDFDNQRFINYQITLLAPRLILLEKILFASIFTFAVTLFFFPMAKLLLGAKFVTTHTSWIKVLLMLYASSLCCSTYTLFIACVIPNIRKLRPFWVRVNYTMITLGGIFIPWHIIKKFSPLLGYITLINPLIYISEGLRSAVLDLPHFLPVWVCVTVLLSFSVLFTLLSFHFFKKRIDHI